ncbi:hypothetical protein VB738_06475 [Cyanobium gracile UHCC 0139]|uniref:Uncharacterized protein n=1 Tax=Cyanobium gracile UHCC 0139 TaxID=3110308 RepID=A0ABU5RT12_9CYAN|nr:hypothetical protein [Cyanobium gracile]MEA5390903.1 hypothetical protein [Cyanobium gracile UHCC 0139]
MIAPRGFQAFQWFEDNVRPLYSETWREVFQAAKAVGGMKLVLGGSSRFLSSHLGSVRKMLLYADSILIPDPILPWLESERQEERFRHALLLEQAFWLLQLKPFIDSDLPYPAVIVFPSWEKQLENNDPVTQQRVFDLATTVIGHHIGKRFSGFDELTKFALKRSQEFLEAVDQSRLLWAPGANSPEPLAEGIARYWQHNEEWRRGEHLQKLRKIPEPLIVLNAIMERIAPQYHVLENAEELAAQPMMAIPSQWYYHEIISRSFEGELAEKGALSAETVAILRSLNHSSSEWLGNVPTPAMVELRRNNENERFRKALAEHTSQLHESTLNDLDFVAAQVGRGIASLISEHRKEVARIAEQYQLNYSKILAGGIVTAAALFAPALAPFVGGLHAPLAIAGSYAHAKRQELLEKGRALRSLTGVLAVADAASN